jgi:hypothetical protein
MPTYKGTITVPWSITTVEPMDAEEIRTSIRAAQAALGVEEQPDEPIEVDIRYPMCKAIARRNTIDGNLYMCEMPEDDYVHKSVEECSAEMGEGRGCEDPAAHHAYESPGWDRPDGPTPGGC